MKYLTHLLVTASVCSVINGAYSQPAEDVLVPAPGAFAGAPDSPDGGGPPRTPRGPGPLSDEMRKRYGLNPVGPNRVFFSNPGEARGRTVLIQHQPIDAKAAATLEEDLSVMTRIFQKTIERTAGGGDGDKAMGIMLSAFPGSRAPQNLYIEGYGALFLLNVRFPLIPSGGKADPEDERAADSSWEQARREVLGQHRPFGIETPRERSPVPYDHDQVETLKTELLACLKDSSHIRGLKLSEHVTVVVTGGETGGTKFMKQVSIKDEDDVAETSQAGKSVTIKRRSARPEGNSRPEIVARSAMLNVNTEDSSSRKSTLTVRIKKSDAEELAAGKITAAEFESRAQVTSY